MPRFLYKNYFLILVSDILIVAFSWYFSYLLRYNFSIPSDTFNFIKHIIPLILLIKILTFYFFNLYKGMWRYTSLADLGSILKATSAGCLIIALMLVFIHGTDEVPRSVYVIDWVLTLILVSGSRITIRVYFWLGAGDELTSIARSGFSQLLNRRQGKKLIIIGAGDCGEKIFREIHDNTHLGFQVVGFIDDDPLKNDRFMHGIPVLDNTEGIKDIVKQIRAEELLIAIPSASSEEMRNIVKRCEESGIPFKTVPGMGELIDGKVTIKAIRDVAYKDLLGREQVQLDEIKIGEYLKGKKVLVTGAGGSIGSELCRQVCRFYPETVILYERAETPLHEIELELKEHFQHIKIIPKLADICDIIQLEKTFEEESPQVVFHAAAYKHVPMLECNPWEAISNNVVGTRNIIEIVREFNVEMFVLVSSDKAVRPTNVMGASKRLAELLVQSQNECIDSNTRFITVRFGNVVGSVGSVVPLFKKQIEKGGPLTVTHPEMTRFFMTIPEACQLILQSGSMGNGGEIFILEMGTPIKISDMARDLIRLSGFEPDVDIKIKYIGLRPGEKMYEELITEGEGIVKTSHEKIMVLNGTGCNMDFINGHLEKLSDLALNQDGEGIRDALREILVGEYGG